LFRSENNPSKKGGISVGVADVTSKSSELSPNLAASSTALTPVQDEYAQLQRRIVMATFLLTSLVVGITAIFFDLQTTTSLLVGSIFGVLYLRLLGRSIEKLGTSSKQVSKIQLIVPVLLVLATTKLPQLDLIPSLLGFLLYKPALIFQMLLES